MPGYMKYSFVLATLLCVQTISTKVEDQMVLFQPGTIFKVENQFQPGIAFEQIDMRLQQAIQIERNHLEERMRRKADWLKFDQKCQIFFLKNILPPLLLFVMVHEEPQKFVSFVVPYLLYMV
jgi:hypothetical protein